MQEFFNQYPWLIYLIQLWVIPWKGIALWIAARRNEKWWFIVLLIVNTLGILEIIYIFFIAKHKFKFLQAKKK
jgi:hypothetical protein